VFLPMLAVVLVTLFLVTFLPVVLVRTARAAPAPATPPALADADRYSRHSIVLAVATGLGAAATVALTWALGERAYFDAYVRAAVTDAAAAADGELIVGVPPTLNLGLVLAPSIMGVVGILVLVIRERRSPLVTAPTRTASLSPRRARDYVSRPFVIIATVTLALLASLLITGILTSDVSGTAHFWHGTWDSAVGPVTATSTRSPWPGWLYSVPILLLAVVQTLLAAIGLRDVAARGQLTPRADDAPHADLDMALRRRSADAVVGLLTISFSLPTIAAGIVIAPVAGDALGAFPMLGRPYLVLGVWALACTALALLALGAGTALVLRRPAAIRERLADDAALDTAPPAAPVPDLPADEGEHP